MKLVDSLTHDFGYHPPSTDKVRAAHEMVRTILHSATGNVLGVCGIKPDDESIPSRELALCKTALEEAMFWANAHIARRMNG